MQCECMKQLFGQCAKNLVQNYNTQKYLHQIVCTETEWTTYSEYIQFSVFSIQCTNLLHGTHRVWKNVNVDEK